MRLSSTLWYSSCVKPSGGQLTDLQRTFHFICAGFIGLGEGIFLGGGTGGSLLTHMAAVSLPSSVLGRKIKKFRHFLLQMYLGILEGSIAPFAPLATLM